MKWNKCFDLRNQWTIHVTNVLFLCSPKFDVWPLQVSIRAVSHRWCYLRCIFWSDIAAGRNWRPSILREFPDYVGSERAKQDVRSFFIHDVKSPTKKRRGGSMKSKLPAEFSPEILRGTFVEILSHEFLSLFRFQSLSRNWIERRKLIYILVSAFQFMMDMVGF